MIFEDVVLNFGRLVIQNSSFLLHSLEKRCLSIRKKTLKKVTKNIFCRCFKSNAFFIVLKIFYFYTYICTKCKKLFIHVLTMYFLWIPRIICFQEHFLFEYIYIYILFYYFIGSKVLWALHHRRFLYKSVVNLFKIYLDFLNHNPAFIWINWTLNYIYPEFVR